MFKSLTIKITKRQLALACLFAIIIDILYPPLLTLSQLGSFPIVRNQWIATSEETDYLYENINPDFKVYFGDKNDPKRHLIRLETRQEVMALEMVKKYATPSATPTASPSATISPEPTITATPSATPTSPLLITPTSQITPISQIPTPTLLFSPTPTATVSGQINKFVSNEINRPIGAPPETLADLINPTPTPTTIHNSQFDNSQLNIDPALAAALQANQQPTRPELVEGPQSTFSGSLEQQTKDIQKDIESLSGQVEEVKKQISKLQQFTQSLEEVTLETQENGKKAVVFRYPSEFLTITYTILGDGLAQKIDFYGSSAFPLDFKVNGVVLSKEPDDTVTIKSLSQNPFLKLRYTEGKTNGKNLGSQVQTVIKQNKITIAANSSFLSFGDLEKESVFPIELTHVFTLFTADTSKSKTLPRPKPKPKVLGFFASSISTYKYENKNEDFTARLVSPTGSASAYFERKNTNIELTLENQNPSSKPVLSDNKITYTEIQRGVDLSYKITDDGLKENIILKDASTSSSFSFAMRTTNLYVVKDYDNLYHFFDKKTAEDMMIFQAPFMDDSASIHSEAVFLKVEPNGKETDDIALWKITLTVDKTFLADSSTVYPVTIDPTVTIGTSAFATKIAKEVNLWRTYNAGTVVTSYSETQVQNQGAPYFNYTASDWDPTPLVYFEAVIFVATTGTTTAGLLAEGDTSAVSNSEVTSTSTTAERKTSSALTLVDGTNYNANFYISSGQAKMNAARLILVQITTGVITKTVTRVPLVFITSTSNTYAADNATTGPVIWKYESGAYDGTVSIYYEATMRVGTSGDRACTQLQPESGGTSIGGPSAVSSTTRTRVTTNTISPTNNSTYEANLARSATSACSPPGSGGTGTVRLSGAFVVVKQVAATGARLTLTEGYLVIGNDTFTAVGTAYATKDTINYFDPANYVNTVMTYHHEAVNFDHSGSSALTSSNIRDITTPADVNTVTQSVGTHWVYKRNSSITMPSSAKELSWQIKDAGNDGYFSSDWVITRIFILGAGAPTGYSFQRKTFYDSANSTHWALYGATSAISQYYATDTATSWTSCSSCTAISEVTNDFSLWFKDGTAYIAYYDTYDIKIQKGTVSATSISWAAAVTALNGTSTSNIFRRPFVTRDKSSGYVWIGAQYYNGTNYSVVASRSTNSGDNVSAWDAATTLSTATTNQTDVGIILPIGTDNMYGFWHENGDLKGKKYTSGGSPAWAASATTIVSSGVSKDVSQNFSGTTDNSDDIHLAYVDSSNLVQYKMYDTSANSWDTDPTQLDGTSSNAFVSTTYQEANQSVYIFWVRSNTLYYVHRTLLIDSWDSSPVSLATLTASTAGFYLTSTYTSSENMVTLRTEGTASPFDVKEDRMTTGLKSIMRHGRTFENETKQRFAY